MHQTGLLLCTKRGYAPRLQEVCTVLTGDIHRAYRRYTPWKCSSLSAFILKLQPCPFRTHYNDFVPVYFLRQKFLRQIVQ
ncbi:hypothetical protein EZS27_004411 [termite gut metagenome]|uniref:Uncharacterized protein n=1 Tax=termite gut metagenome TaxID=433724 RepID=A0A5J4SQ43_9ZZZZ